MSKLPIADCSGCGVCCLHMGFPAFNLSVDQLRRAGDDREQVESLSESAKADRARWLKMPRDLQRQILKLMEDYRPLASGDLDGPCVWLDPTSRLCMHHQHRPQVCRDFAVGSAGCLQWRAAKSECIASN